MDAVVVSIRDAVEYAESNDVDSVGVGELNRPIWTVLNRHVADQQILTLGKDEHVSRTVQGQHGPISHFLITVDIVLSLTDEFTVEINVHTFLVQIHERCSIPIQGTVPADRNIFRFPRQDQSKSIVSLREIVRYSIASLEYATGFNQEVNIARQKEGSGAKLAGGDVDRASAGLSTGLDCLLNTRGVDGFPIALRAVIRNVEDSPLRYGRGSKTKE